jgi:zinc/manganese transport system permease protein
VPQEALIGITYVVASATVILLSSFSAEGAEHLQETMSGALIWVTWPTVIKVGLSYGAVGLLHYLLREKFLAVSFHEDRVSHVRFWDFIFYATFGTVITSSVQIAGVLMVFSVLVIPAVVAFFYARTFRRALLVAWGTGTVAILAGLGTSFWLDLTTGPVVVCAFGLLLMVALLFRRRFGVVLAPGERRGLVVRDSAGAGKK